MNGNGPICQSCGMVMKAPQEYGSTATGAPTTEYCTHCYRRGVFTHASTMEEMLENNLKYLDHWNEETGNNFTPDEARPLLREFLSTLKRWK